MSYSDSLSIGGADEGNIRETAGSVYLLAEIGQSVEEQY